MLQKTKSFENETNAKMIAQFYFNFFFEKTKKKTKKTIK